MLSVWAHSYAVHRHMVAALQNYTHPTWLIFWGSGSLVESNDVIMSWLRLTATSNCFLHSYWTYTKCLSTLICYPLAYGSSLVIPTLLGSYFGVLGHLWSQNEWLCHGWGWQPPQTASHIHIRHIQFFFENIHMLSMTIQYQPYIVIPTLVGWYFGALGHLWSQNDVIMSRLRLTATSNCFPHPY